MSLTSLASADRAFATRFSTNDTGAIISAANTLMTCPTTASGCSNATTVGDDSSGNTALNNNNYAMVHVNQDTTSGLIDSSTAALNIPAGATVLFAGLYYGADLSKGTNGTAAAPNPSADNKVSIKVPGSSTYTQLTASTLDVSAQNSNRYQGFVDVTSLVSAAGAGNYTVGGVQEGTGEDTYGGWSIVVAYHLDTDPPRNLTIDDGLVSVAATSNPVSFTVNGFKTPPSGTVNTNLGFISYEGDEGFVGDSASLDGHTLSDAAHPANNFFDSAIANDGVAVSSKSPNFVNQMGYDSSFINAAGLLPNSATSATVALTTNGDAYYPGVVTFQTDLYAPKIVQSKTVADVTHPGGPVQEGDTLKYDITGVNNGSDGASNFKVNDPIPPNTTYLPGSLKVVGGAGATAGNETDASGDDLAEFSSASNSVTFRIGTGATATTGGVVAPAATYDVQFEVTANGPAVNPVAPDTDVPNTATSTYLAQTLGTSLSSTSSADTKITAPDLSITKSLTSTPPVTAGSNAAYGLEIKNIGDAPTQGTVTVTDNLPTGESLTTPFPTLSGWTCTSTAGATVVTCTTTNALAAGYDQTIPVTTKVASNASGNLSNTATVAGGGDGNLSNNSSTDTVPSTATADISLTKTASKGTVNVGDTDTFTLTATNNGPSDATSVAITDPLPAGFVYVSSTQPAGGSCTIDPVTGSVVCQVGTLASGASVAATIVVKALPSAATKALTNTATVAAQQKDSNPNNNSASTTVNVTGADMSVVKTVDGNPTQLTTGSTVSYTIVATNNGPSDTTNATISDIIPSNLTVASNGYTTSDGTCAVTNGTLNCVDPTLANGASFTVHVTGTVNSASAATTLTNTATATSDVTDPNTSNNSSTATTPLTAQADLSVTKTATPDPATPGTNETFTIVTTNKGPDTAVAAQVTDALPAGLSFVSASTGCTNAAGTVTCNLGDLASGASKTVTITAAVSASATGTITNSATASSNTPDPDTSNNTGTSVTSVASTDDDAITKTVDNANPTQGSNVTYTLTATNSGPATSTGTTVTDTLPAGVTYVSNDAGCTVLGSTVSCAVGNLAPGGSQAIHIVATVNNPTVTNAGETFPITVQKIEDSFSLQGGQQQSYTITCPTGYWMTDGSAQIDAVDQGTGTLASAVVLQSYEQGKSNYVALIRNESSGQAQGHITGVCLSNMTGPGSQGSGPEDLVESDPIMANEVWQAGEHTVTLTCGPNQHAFDPSWLFDNDATVRGVQQSADGKSITFTVDVPESVNAQLYIRCLDDQVTNGAGSFNTLQYTTATNTVSVPPSSGSGFTSVQATCPTGYEGIVASWIVDPGLVMIGNDPQPITRVFYIYNPTNQPLNATVSLLCVAINTGPTQAMATVTNTASISSTTTDSNTANNTASATFTANGLGNHAVLRNPASITSNAVKLTTGAKGSFLRFTVACAAAQSCSGVADVATTSGVKLGSVKYAIAAGKHRILKVHVKAKHAKVVKAAKRLKVTLRATGRTARSKRLKLTH